MLVVQVVLELLELILVEMELLEEIPLLDLLDLLILVNQITPLLKAVDTAAAGDLVDQAADLLVVLAVLVVEEDLVVMTVQDQELNQELIHLPLSLTMEIMEVQGHHQLVPLLEGEVLVVLGQIQILPQQIHLDLVVLDNHSPHLHLHL